VLLCDNVGSANVVSVWLAHHDVDYGGKKDGTS
jgi:hypothetical protein